MTDTNHETRGFPKIEPLDAPPEMARFMTAMRRLQDIAVSTAPGGTCGRTRPSASRTCAVAWKLAGHRRASLTPDGTPNCPGWDTP